MYSKISKLLAVFSYCFFLAACAPAATASARRREESDRLLGV